MKDFMSDREAAEALGVGVRAVQARAARGSLPGSHKVGRRWRIARSSVEAAGSRVRGSGCAEVTNLDHLAALGAATEACRTIAADAASATVDGTASLEDLLAAAAALGELRRAVDLAHRGSVAAARVLVRERSRTSG